MVSDRELDGVFHALSDPTRRSMLRRLSEGPAKIGDLAAPFPMSFAAASKHVKVLEEAGLIARQIEGRAHICRIAPARLRDAEAWLTYYERFWTVQFDALEALIDNGEI
jgi:DNA-binding transcriptional ArsR family regulator